MKGLLDGQLQAYTGKKISWPSSLLSTGFLSYARMPVVQKELKWPRLNKSHFLHRILDSKKTSRFQFSVPGLREIHRNLKQQKKFNSRDGFFRKSPFCTFSCINPGFGGPWGML